MDELDEINAWARGRSPFSLALNGWDHASIWGWDETTGSLYAHLWRNTDDPAKPPTVRIGPDDYTPAITLLPILAQHIAMAVDCDPWEVLTALYEIFDQDNDWSSEEEGVRANESDTFVTITEGHGIWWPPNFG